MAGNLNLQLRINALVKGTKDVQALAVELSRVIGASKTKAGDPLGGIAGEAKGATKTLSSATEQADRLTVAFQRVRQAVQAATQAQARMGSTRNPLAGVEMGAKTAKQALDALDQRPDRAKAKDDVKALGDEIRKTATEAKKGIPDPTKGVRDGVKQTRGMVAEFRNEILGLFALSQIKSFLTGTVDAVTRTQGALKGLESVARFTGVGVGEALKAAEAVAADGLVNIADASKALQNLLQRGYNLDEAVNVLNRLKDAAAFNRQASLSMSEAVVSATEGLKNENSILVDNAGVTKNVAQMWKEYAAQSGKTVEELTQAEKIQAEINGIMAETEAQVGNAAKAAEGFQGLLAQLNKEVFDLKVRLGDELLPALTTLAKWGGGFISNFVNPLLKGIKLISVSVAAVTQDMIALVESNSFEEIGKKLKANAALFKQELDRIVNETDKDLSIRAEINLDPPDLAKQEAQQKRINRPTGGGSKKKVTDFTDELLAVQKAAIDAQAKLEVDGIERTRSRYRAFYDQRLIDARMYYEEDAKLQQQAIDVRLGALQQERDAAATRVNNPAGTEADRLRAAANVKRLDAEIATARRDRGMVEVQASEAAAKAERDLADAMASVREQNAALTGVQTREDRIAAGRREQRALLQQLEASGDTQGVAQVNQLIDARATADQFAEIEAQAQRAMERVRLAEERIRTEVDAGLISQFEAQKRLGEERAKALPEMDQLISQMEALAASSDSAMGQRQALNIQNLRQQIEALKRSSGILGQQLKDIGQSNLADAFYQIATAASSLKDVFSNLVRSILQDIARLASQELARQLLGGLIGAFAGAGATPTPTAAGGGASTGFYGAIGRNSGGPVPGVGNRDTVPAMLTPGEYVIKAPSVRKWGAGFLQFINDGKGGPADLGGRMGFAAGGQVPEAPNLSGNGVRIVNVPDGSLLEDFLDSARGERVVLNIIKRNRSGVRASLA